MFPALVLGGIALWVHEQQVTSELLVRRREFVTKFIAFYAALKMCQGIASEYLKRSTREGIYFALMVCWLVFQSLYLYEWHHLDDDLPEVKPETPQEDSPFVLTWAYICVWIHEAFIYVIVISVFSCAFVAGLGVLWNWRERRRRRQQQGDFPEYREEDFDQPDLVRADSINMRVGHLERLKKAAKTQLPVEDGTECIICMNEFVKDDELVQLECSDKHIYHFQCL